MKTFRFFRLVTILSLILSSLGIPIMAQAQNPTVVLFDDFSDGELDSNPHWDATTSAWSVINGQLHHDGAITDGSDRYRTNFTARFADPDQKVELGDLEMSFYGLLKSDGNPQIGRGIELNLIGDTGPGTDVGAYMLR